MASIASPYGSRWSCLDPKKQWSGSRSTEPGFKGPDLKQQAHLFFV